MTTQCSVYELRQYTLHPGRRDELIELFDAELVEPQEQVGMHVIGQFRDLDRDDRFVWLRGFADMPARADGLTRFYLEGEAWARHRGAANATMIDSDDVLLLRGVPGTPDLCSATPAPQPGGVLAIDVHHLVDGADAEHVWRAEVEPVLAACRADVVAVLRSEHTPNNFPQLPVRDDADVLVVISRFDSRGALPASTTTAERVVVEPTARSALR